MATFTKLEDDPAVWEAAANADLIWAIYQGKPEEERHPMNLPKQHWYSKSSGTFLGTDSDLNMKRLRWEDTPVHYGIMLED